MTEKNRKIFEKMITKMILQKVSKMIQKNKKEKVFSKEKGCSFLVGVFCVFLWLCSFLSIRQWCFFHARFGTTFSKKVMAKMIVGRK